jgi:hypothetical protein
LTTKKPRLTRYTMKPTVVSIFLQIISWILEGFSNQKSSFCNKNAFKRQILTENRQNHQKTSERLQSPIEWENSLKFLYQIHYRVKFWIVMQY